MSKRMFVATPGVAAGRLTFLSILVMLSLASPAHAGAPTITPQGSALGFTITTFATLNPGNTGLGSFGIAVASNGNIIVSNYPDGTRYVWPDVDGQTVGSAITSVASNTFVTAYVTAGGKPYGSDGVGHFVQFKDDATIDHVLTGVTPNPQLGMWANPVNGHIIATSSVGLLDIDPLAGGGLGSFRVINAQFGDGISVSPDGKTVYVAEGAIVGYDIATGAVVFGPDVLSNPPSLNPDGTGVIISTNSLNGQIIVNDNNGSIFLLNPANGALVTIASGGTRGDYVSPDTRNGTLFLDYSDVVARLSCGSSCSFSPQAPAAVTTRKLDGPYQIRYASNLTIGDSVINITNTGANGNNLFGPGFGKASGNICVNVYAFSPDEQMISCCSCLVTPNGLVHLTANNDLVSNTLTGIRPNSIVIKLVATGTGSKLETYADGSSATVASHDKADCTNSAALAGTLFPVVDFGLLASGTTLHSASNNDPPTGGVFSITETPFLPATLNPDRVGFDHEQGLDTEINSLANRCTNIIGNGSSFGICRSCRVGGLGGAKQ